MLTSALNVVLRYSMVDHTDFHKAIVGEPDEDLHHLAYADFVEENGDEKAAGLIRKAVTEGYAGQHQNAETVDVPDKVGDFHIYAGEGRTPDGRKATLQRVVTKSGVDPTKALVWYAPTQYHPELKEGPDEIREEFGRSEQPVRYASVPDFDVHPDYQRTGHAPRIGQYLNQLASEDSDAGLLAEGILRTGSHSLLPILADKLDETDHPLKASIDWRHADRAQKIDSVLKAEIGRHRVRRSDGTRHPLSPGWLVSNWSVGQSRPLGRRKAMTLVKAVVPDATKDDLHHSLLRLMDVRDLSAPNANASVEPMPEYHREWAKAKVQELGSIPVDPHRYPDTRPANKRLYRLKELLAKYGVYRSPKDGMVVQESKLAVVGQYVPGGKFTRDLTKLDDTPTPTSTPTPKPKLTLTELKKRIRLRRTV